MSAQTPTGIYESDQLLAKEQPLPRKTIVLTQLPLQILQETLI
jgi:hypothetical protein